LRRLTTSSTTTKPPSPHLSRSPSLSPPLTTPRPSLQSVNEAISTYRCRGPYSPTFGSKTKGEGKAWHPGLLGHQYRADSLSYFLLEVAKEALTEVITASMEGPKTLHELHQQTAQTLAQLSHASHHLPRPVACNKEVCLSDAQCFTNFEPRIQNDLLARVVPTRDISHSVSLLHPPVAPSSVARMPLSLASLLPSNWIYDLSWFDKSGVLKAAADNRGYLDKKFILRSNFTGSGPVEDGGSVLTLLVEPSRPGPLWLCQVQKGFLKYPSSDSELDVGARVALTSPAPLMGAAGSGSFREGLKGCPSPPSCLPVLTRSRQAPLSGEGPGRVLQDRTRGGRPTPPLPLAQRPLLTGSCPLLPSLTHRLRSTSPICSTGDLSICTRRPSAATFLSNSAPRLPPSLPHGAT
jgi:hypothetical protein